MPTITLTIDEATYQTFSAMAKRQHQAEEEYLKRLLEQHIKPANKWIGISESGGEVSVYESESQIKLVVKNVNQQQLDVIRRAELLINPRNGSHWDKAWDLLQSAGFEIFYT